MDSEKAVLPRLKTLKQSIIKTWWWFSLRSMPTRLA